jgi:phosphatidylinositol alpha-mannosyltransferase
MKIGLVSPYDWSYPGGVRDHVWHLANEFMALNLRMRRILQREHFDILHIHEPLAPGLSLSALRCSDTVNIGTFHASTEISNTSTFNLAYASTVPFLRPFWKRLHGRIAVSHATSKFIGHYFPADYRIIPNGIHLDQFQAQAAPFPAFMDGKQNILFLGRFEKRKGAKYLLRAIPTIRESFPQTRFIFAGEGRLRAGFQRFVERQGWHDVIFTGYVPEEEKARYFASAHVFCAPATGGESLGIVLLEAMATGTPIVASNISGYRTVITPEVDGLLTPPRSSSELAAAVVRLLRYEPLRQRFGQAGLQRAYAYAWPSVASKVLDYYQEVLEEQKNPTGRKIYG